MNRPAGSNTIPAGTVTFLFTDIEGSTNLWEAQPDAMRLSLARHDVLLREAIENANGYVFKTVGDSFCAAFTTATDALEADLAAQRALTNEPWPEKAPLRVRMALHTGAVESRDGDYFGTTLNRVARLLATGHGGQTLLSQATYELVRDHLPQGADLRDLELHHLKDLQRPEHVYQLLHFDLPADFPKLRSIDPLRNNLPIQATSFVGRDEEIKAVKALLAKTRLLTLTGSGGAGKTRLSLQVAAELIESMDEGVWLAEFAPLSDPGQVARTLAEALGVREEPGGSITQNLVDFLRPKSLLLVLDNCEHVLDAAAGLCEAILRTCLKVKIIASSREGLNIAGETTYRIPSLSVPDLKRSATPESLSHYEAVRLFIERAQATHPSFCVTNANAPAVAQICHRLDGIPYAIELAAAKVRVLSAEQINARLDDRFRLLTGGSRTALPRQQTLRTMLDWSYDLLSAEEQTLLRRLSVFTGGGTLEAAEAVCADLETAWPDSIPMNLDEKECPDCAEIIKAKARKCKHCGYEFAPVVVPLFASPPVPVAPLRLESGEIVDLLSHLVDKNLVVYEENASGQGRYRLLETVRQYARDRLLESGEADLIRTRHLGQFLAFAEQMEPRLHGAEQVAILECLEEEHDNLRTALTWSSQADPTAAETMLRLAGALPWFWHMRGYGGEGLAWLARALELPSGHSGANPARAATLQGAGLLAFFQGDYAAAAAYFEESVALWQQIGDGRKVAEAICLLGPAAVMAGRWTPRHRELVDEGIALARASGDKWVLARLLFPIAVGTHERGDDEAAALLFEECAALYREVGDAWCLSGPLEYLGEIRAIQGDPDTGRALLEEGLTLARRVGGPWKVSSLLDTLGEVALMEGDIARARPLIVESLALCRQMNNKRRIAYELCNLGHVARREADFGQARALYGESLALYRELDGESAVAKLLDGFARLVAAEGKPLQAARLFGALEALQHSPGSFERPDHDQAITAARAALDEATFAAAFAEGQAMTLNQAVAYALEEKSS